MSEPAAGKLRTQELHRLLDHLRDYIASCHAVILLIRSGSPDSCGNPIHLDGPAFLAGFVQFLQDKNLDADRLLSELCLVMELSGYVRHGGTKALAYRLETGCFNITPNYFDNIADELCYELLDGKFKSAKQLTNSFLFQRIRAIEPEDELRVSAAIAEIDEILLALGRKLEDASDQALGTIAMASETVTVSETKAALAEVPETKSAPDDSVTAPEAKAAAAEVLPETKSTPDDSVAGPETKAVAAFDATASITPSPSSNGAAETLEPKEES